MLVAQFVEDLIIGSHMSFDWWCQPKHAQINSWTRDSPKNEM